jgi:zinc/manganese transport system substrate-binding protein
MRSPYPRHPLTAGLAALGLALAACGTDGDGDDVSAGAQQSTDDLTVVATTSILGDVVGELVQDDGTVEVIMPPGVDPHGFEPSAREAALLRDADLVVANGLQLEENLSSALEAAEEEGVDVFEVAGHLDPIPFDWDGPHDHGHEDEDDDHGHEDEDDDHGHEGDEGHGDESDDPHVWHDPVRMADGVDLIAERLADVSEVVDADEWQQRADAYSEQLLAVHEEVEEILASVPDEDRKLVTNHDAFGYLAMRYDFEVLGTVIPGSSADAETNPQAFAELIETVEEAGVPAVFSENVEGDRLSTQLAGEVGDRGDIEIEVVELYSDALGEPDGDGGTYLDLLRTNAQRIADALG